MDKNVKIGFIGCGNMGQALISGIIKSKKVNAQDIMVCDNDSEKTAQIAKEYKTTVSTAPDIASGADVVIIAVKPDHVEQVLKDIRGNLTKDTIMISIAAGISVSKLENIVGAGKKVIRVMPNTPAMVLEGASVLVRGADINDDNMQLALEIFRCVGLAIELPETKMDAVTGVSGSSPAFIFQIIEAMGDAGVRAGLDRKTAVRLSAQAVLGAAKMVIETGMHPAELKDMVTSPAGTTIEGVYEMEKHGVRAAMISAVSAAVSKSKDIHK